MDERTPSADQRVPTDTVPPGTVKGLLDDDVPALADKSASPDCPCSCWNKWLVFVLLCLTVGILDQISKQWAHQDLRKQPGKQITVVKNYLALSYVRNPGAAWGLFAKAKPGFRKPFFISVNIAAMLFILIMLSKLPVSQRLTAIALSLVMGGAIGNLIDRVRFGYVIDFIDVHYKTQFRWPTFNVADIAISVGVGLLLLEMVLARRHASPPTRET